MSMPNTAPLTGSTHERAVRKPIVTKHEPRLKAEPFDPALVSTSLNSAVAKQVKADAERVDRMMGRSRLAAEAPVSMPSDVAEVPERFYNDRMDPCSPNFDPYTWI